MGWAKYEEDNREIRDERLASGNYFWTPYTSQNTYTPSYYKPEASYPFQIKQAHKDNTYAYRY